MSNTKDRQINLEEGNKSEVSKKLEEKVVSDFADVSEDYNPLHVDEEYAQDGPFGESIAHGLLGLSLVSASLAQIEGDIVLDTMNDVNFHAPVIVGESVTATCKITSVNDIKATVEFEVTTNTSEKTVITGNVNIIDASELDL